MSQPHDTPSTDARRELARLGTAALPPVHDIADLHLRAIERAVVDQARSLRVGSAKRAPLLVRRRAVFAMAAAALVVVPSMAFAGVLPDRIQHAASRAAAAVGVHLPDVPADPIAPPAASTKPSGDAAPSGSTGLGLGDEIRGTVPGKPAAGEERGNRFGQVEGGPDRGTAGQVRTAPTPSTNADVRPPASPPGQATDTVAPATSAPADAPAPPPSNAGSGNREFGSAGGNGASKRAKS